MNLISCAVCEKMISPNAAGCPSCGEPRATQVVGELTMQISDAPQGDAGSLVRDTFIAILVIGLGAGAVYLLSFAGEAGESVVTSVLIFAAYFLPWMIAAGRNHHNAGAIALLNLFLGWTLLGWLIALIWSASAIKPELRPAHPIT